MTATHAGHILHVGSTVPQQSDQDIINFKRGTNNHYGLPCFSAPENGERHRRAADVAAAQGCCQRIGSLPGHAVVHLVAAVAAVHHVDGVCRDAAHLA